MVAGGTERAVQRRWAARASVDVQAEVNAEVEYNQRARAWLRWINERAQGRQELESEPRLMALVSLAPALSAHTGRGPAGSAVNGGAVNGGASSGASTTMADRGVDGAQSQANGGAALRTHHSAVSSVISAALTPGQVSR